MVRVPGNLHRPAGSYAPNRMAWGPVARPIRRLPVQGYRQLTNIPLQPSNAQAIVSHSTIVFATPKLVQSAWITTTTTTATITLGSSNPGGPSPGPTTTGNCLIVGVAESQGSSAPAVSGITLGGGADNWASVVAGTGDANAEIWADDGCAGGQTAIVVTFTAGTGVTPGHVVYVEEWSGLLTSGAADKHNVASGVSMAPSSGSTGTLSQAAELVWGMIAEFGGSAGTITGPAAPWVNTTQINQSTNTGLMAGHQVVAATTGLTYAGTISVNDSWTAAIASFKAASSVLGVAGLASCQLGPAGLGNLWYPAQVTLSTTTGIANGFDNSVANLYLGPVADSTTLLGTVFGGNGVVAAALPNIQPGLSLIAQWTGANPGDVASMNINGVMDALG